MAIKRYCNNNNNNNNNNNDDDDDDDQLGQKYASWLFIVRMQFIPTSAYCCPNALMHYVTPGDA